MGEPAAELLPAGAELVPRLFSQQEALLLVAPEHVIQLAGCGGVDDDGIFLKVTLQAAGIEIGAAHGAIASVNHHDFGVVEAGLVEPHHGTALHQLVGLVEGAVRRQRDVALGRQHDFDLHPSADGACQSPRHTGYQREVGVDDVDGVLRLIDGADVEGAHDFWRDAGFAVDDAHHLAPCRGRGVGLQPLEARQRAAAVVFHAADVLAGRAVPYPEEDGLQLVDGVAFDAAMHVAPFTHLFRTFNIIVGHIHAAGIGYLTVDDHNLAVVAAIDVVDPREADGGVLYDVDAVVAQRLEVVLLQRLVVGVVAKTVEHGPDLDTLLALFAQDVEQQRGDAVVAEVEILQVDAALSLPDGAEHVVKLLLA